MKRLRTILLSTLISGYALATSQSGFIDNMSLFSQKQSQWCWAASTETISKIMGKEKSQCKMVSRFIKKQAGSFCCDATQAATSQCNQPYALGDSLSYYGFLDQTFKSKLTTMQIIGDLQRRHPVAVRIGWDRGGGHFLVIYGATQLSSSPTTIYNEVYNLWNPLPIGKGDKQVVKRAALVRYNNAGNWTHTYTVKNP